MAAPTALNARTKPAAAPLALVALAALGTFGVLGACSPPAAEAPRAAPRSTPRLDAEAPSAALRPTPFVDAEAYNRYAREGRMRFRTRDYRGAAQSYERVLAANPADDAAVYFLALASLKMGDPATALRWLTRLAEAGSDLVPTRDQFQDLVDNPEFQAISRRLVANAARHHHSVEAFRIPEKGLLAEGIAYDPVEPAFYVGSATRRKIVKVVPGRAPVDFAGPGPQIDAIGGLRVDAKRRRLWAASGTDRRMDGFSPSEPARSALVSFDLDTGAIVSIYRVANASEHDLNDVTIDAEGRPFASDTPGGQIYALAPDGRTLAPLFDAPPFFRPNGLTFDDTGKTLFVGDSAGVHRVDVAARKTVPLVRPVGNALGLFDGLYFLRSTAGPRLVGIQSSAGPGRVVAATLSPALDAITGTQTLESDHPLFDAPTTGAVVGSSFFIIANSQLWGPREPAETIIVKTPL